MGAGMMLGPIIGTGLYYLGGYMFMLSSIGVIFILLALMGPFMFPPLLDLYSDVAKKELIEKYSEEEGDADK